jgi:glutathione S-transferase
MSLSNPLPIIGAIIMNYLRLTPASPFGRKCHIAARYLDLMDQVKVIDNNEDEGDKIRSRNPLNKIPMLLTAAGEAIFDSGVIMDYLDDMAGGGKIIPRGPQRFAVLTQQALADGLCDAVILIVYEKNWREDGQHSKKWLDHQRKKMDTTLAYWEKHLPHDGIDAGTIAVAAALGYLDLRFNGEWRAHYPTLRQWMERFEKLPAYQQTHFAG